MDREGPSHDELVTLSGALESVAWTADPSLRITFASPNAAAVFGYPPATWCSDPAFWSSRLHPDEREVTLAMCRAVAEDGQPRRFLHRFGLPNGSTRWVRTALIARRGGDAVTQLVGLTAAVPEVVALHEREGEAQRLILDQLPAIVWTTDRELRFTSGSGAGLASIGLSPNQLVGGTVYEYFRVEDREHPYVAAHLRALAGGTATFAAEWIGRSYQIHVEPFLDRDGQISGVLGVALDITERVRAEADRDAQRQLMAALVSNMVEGVVVSTVDGRLSIINAAARRMLALFDEPVAETLRDVAARGRLLGPDGHVLGYGELPLARALAGETVPRAELTVEHGGRLHHFIASSAPILDEGGTKTLGAVAVARDESERVEFELVKDQFLRVAAHELKTPITILKAHAQGLQRRVQPADPQVQEMLAAIGRGADRLTRVIDDLIDVSQLQLRTLDLRMEPLDLAAMVVDTVGRITARAGRHELRVQPSGPVRVRGDRVRLAQCVWILLDNAVKYSPRGGAIDVAVTRDGARAVVAVTDRGVGIPVDKQDRVFQRFHRAHTDTPYDFGGLGVGLYLLKEIVQRHGGDVSFDSEPGRGSTFRFSLPTEVPA